MNSQINIEQLIEDEMLETYLMASSFFRNAFGAWKSGYDSKEEIDILGALHNARPMYLGLDEINGVTGISKRSLAGKLFNLTSRGYISIKTEKIEKKKRVLYSITVYGDSIYKEHMEKKIAEIQNS